MSSARPTVPVALQPPVPSAWEIPPASSHLFGWFFTGGMGPMTQAHGAAIPGTYGGIITIKFKNTADPYEYRFNDETVARSWLALLRGASEPGKIVWDMRRAGIKGIKV